MKPIILFFIVVIYSCTSFAQTSVFKDGDGESAYKIFGNAITINAKDEAIEFSSDFFKRNPESPNKFDRFGISVKATANEGLSNLKNAKGFLIDGSIGLYKSWITLSDTLHPPKNGAWKRAIFINANLLVDRNKLYNLSNPADEITYTKGYLGWKIESGIFGYTGNWLLGGSANFGQTTNVDDLETNTISTVLQTSGSTSALSQTTAFNSAEFEKGLFNFRFNADAAILLNRKAVTGENRDKLGSLLLGAHLRYKVMEKDQGTFNPGLGLYISKIGSPTEVVAGLNFQLMDAFNVKNEDESSWGRTAINLTVGFKL